MVIWYYYNADNHKVGPLTVSVLKELVRKGVITRETVIENTNGRTVVAGTVNGLIFPEPTSPGKEPTVPPVPAKIPGLVVQKRKKTSRPIVVLAGIAGVVGVLFVLVWGGILWKKSLPPDGTSQNVNQPDDSSLSAPARPPQVPDKPQVLDRPLAEEFAEVLRKGTVQDVNAFMKEKEINVNARVFFGNTALHIAAAEASNAEVVKDLIEAGADINLQDRFGRTPLLSVARSRNHSHIELLVSRGADVNARDNDGKTPLHYVIRVDAPGNFETVKFLVSKGADVNAQDSTDRFTPLHDVLMRPYPQSLEIAEFLVSKGADLNTKDKYGQTPIDKVREMDRKEALEYLSNVKARNP